MNDYSDYSKKVNDKFIRRVDSLMNARDRAENPEFKDLWQRKLDKLIKNRQRDPGRGQALGLH